ncbi:MAG: alginate export family protein [Acidobacteriia bacterium]|nr:alginate export family protein [Terriglobia bacterium]
MEATAANHAANPATPSNLSSEKPQAQSGMALTAFPAAEVNKEFPKWLRLSGEYRVRPEEHTAYSFAPGNNDGFFLSRMRLNLEMRPTTWFTAFVQAQDSEAMGIAPAHIATSVKDVFDLRQAYVQFQKGEKSWIQFRAGRQELRFGQERLIGVSDWANAPRVFDGFRLSLGTNRDHVDVFSASVVVNNPEAFDQHAGGMNFHGMYGSFSSLVPKARVEPFVFWRALPLVKSEEGTVGDENLWTYGFRWTGKLPMNFDYTVEAAKQAGNYSSDAVGAWGGYANVGYSIPKAPLQPRFLVQYDYASGDNRAKDGKAGTFDQLYPSNHDVFGLVDLFGWRNIAQERAGVEVKPLNRLSVNFDFRNLYLANGNDSLYGSAGSVLVKTPATGAPHRDVGQEPDLLAKYDVRENISIGAGYGYLFAGRFLTEHSAGERASIVYTFATYKF